MMGKRRVKKMIENGKMSAFYRVLLVVWDIFCINGCSFLALFIRYELNVERF